MSDFNVAVFRVADSSDPSKLNQPVLEERYIALIPSTHHSTSSWYASDTLFGLHKQMKNDVTLNWEEVEKELSSKGFYKLLPQKSEEEKSLMEQARKQSV